MKEFFYLVTAAKVKQKLKKGTRGIRCPDG
jgi:hypothetical protein